MKGVCMRCGAPTWDRCKAKICRACYDDQLRQRKGEKNPEWNKATSIDPQQGRDRASRRLRKLGGCEYCGAPAIDRHHIDNNPFNNSSKNLVAVCRRCHMQIDGRLTKLTHHGMSTQFQRKQI